MGRPKFPKSFQRVALKNKFASATREMKLKARQDLGSPELAELARLDEAGFRRLFAGSPVKRIGYARPHRARQQHFAAIVPAG